LKKVLFILLAFVFVLGMGLIGCEGEGEGEGIPLLNPDDFIQETIGDLDSLDPAWGYDTASGEQVQYIYETLLIYDGTSTDTFLPALATNWTVVNATQIRFTIKEGVSFHEGGTLTPEDVEYSFERMMVQDRGGGPAWMINLPLLGTYRTRTGAVITTDGEDIDNAVEVDGNEVVFNFAIEFPMVQWLQILVQPWGSILDKEWCVTNGEWDPATDPLSGEGWKDYNNPAKADSYLYNHANGTGPWEFDTWEPGEYVRLTENADYWRGAPPFGLVVTKFNDEYTSRRLSLLNGDADLIYVPRQYIGDLEGNADLNAYSDLPALQNTCIFFNFSIDPDSDFIGSGALDGDGIPPDFFTDEHVRKGFCYAFDYDTFIADAFLGEATQMGNPLVDGLLGYDANAAKYSHCLTAAAAELDLAWGGNVSSLGFKFTVTYNSGNIERKTGCEILAEQLLAIDPKYQVAIQPLTWPTFLDNIFLEDPGVHKGPLPLFQIGWLADYPDPDNFITPYMHSYGDWAYYQDYGYPSLDTKIETARYETDDATRVTLYAEICDIYHEDAPGIMLCQGLGRRWFTKYIHGFYFNPTIPGPPGPLYYMDKY
jgi:peptide/nickel transport system substrate-binding protein